MGNAASTDASHVSVRSMVLLLSLEAVMSNRCYLNTIAAVVVHLDLSDPEKETPRPLESIDAPIKQMSLPLFTGRRDVARLYSRCYMYIQLLNHRGIKFIGASRFSLGTSVPRSSHNLVDLFEPNQRRNLIDGQSLSLREVEENLHPLKGSVHSCSDVGLTKSAIKCVAELHISTYRLRFFSKRL